MGMQAHVVQFNEKKFFFQTEQALVKLLETIKPTLEREEEPPSDAGRAELWASRPPRATRSRPNMVKHAGQYLPKHLPHGKVDSAMLDRMLEFMAKNNHDLMPRVLSRVSFEFDFIIIRARRVFDVIGYVGRVTWNIGRCMSNVMGSARILRNTFEYFKFSGLDGVRFNFKEMLGKWMGNLHKIYRIKNAFYSPVTFVLEKLAPIRVSMAVYWTLSCGSFDNLTFASRLWLVRNQPFTSKEQKLTTLIPSSDI